MAVKNAGTVAAQVLDRWKWWRDALKDPAQIGRNLPVHPDVAELGYYRTRVKAGPWEPVGIWLDDDHQMVAFRGERQVDPVDVFSWCCRNPVSYDAYMAARNGKGWPDDDLVVASQVNPPEPTIGDNSGAVDPFEAMKDQIEAAISGMAAYSKVSDDETAAKALSLRNRLNELSRDADKVRTKEKEPHLEAGKAVDAKWQPWVKKAKTGADMVRDAIGTWETEKLRRQREAERKAEEGRRAAEEAAREQHSDVEVLEHPAPAAAVEAAPAAIKPSYGKSASVQVKIVVDQVTDWTALATYMANHPDCQEVLRKLAQRALDAGRTNIPGVTTTEKAAVR